MSETTREDDWYPTAAELKGLRPIAEKDVALLEAYRAGAIKKRGRPKLTQKKQVVSLRLDPAILEAFRATGKGWQVRLNAMLLRAVQEGRV